jgi:uncharacterized MAPEG superfamily protein
MSDNEDPMELTSAVLASALVLLAVLVQHVTNISRKGVGYVLSSRSEPPAVDGFAGRAARTLQNNLESCAMYAPLALAIVVLHKESVLSYWAALIYVVARVVFDLCYWFKVEGLRSTAWLAGIVATAIMTACVFW